MRYIIIFVSFYILTPCGIFCQVGQIDTSFGDNGVVFEKDFESVSGLITQSDGKLIVAALNAQFYSCLIRYMENGSIDSTFGVNGIAEAGIALNYSAGTLGNFGHNLVVQPDGYLIICGTVWLWNYGFVLALQRFNQNGIVDTSFGEDGIVTTSVPVTQNAASCVAVYSDKIIAGTRSSNFFFTVYSFNNDGSNDLYFGDNGVRLFPGNNFNPRDIEVDMSGRIFLCGTFGPTSSVLSAGLICLNSAGDPENSFSSDGFLKVDLPYFYAQFYDLEIENDGKIIATGSGDNWPSFYYSLIRVNGDGSMDTTFGVDGIVTNENEENIITKAIVIQPDQKILVAAEKADSWLSVMRLTSSGSLDSTFGTNGTTITEVGLEAQYATNLVVQPSGKIVLGGYIQTGFNNDSIVLIRYIGENTIPTSIKSLGEYTFSIYPNPSSKIITIDRSLFEEEFLLGIQDISGEIVKQEKVSSHSLDSMVTINIEDLQAGIYFVAARNSDHIASAVFVKQ
jgi:uncharacterized delta-60 repeat protein